MNKYTGIEIVRLVLKSLSQPREIVWLKFLELNYTKKEAEKINNRFNEMTQHERNSALASLRGKIS